MKRCLLTYDLIEGEGEYSARGLKLLDRNLTSLAPLPYTAEEQRAEALKRAGKMSIQGLQLKLSALLKVKAGVFDVVDRNGRFILNEIRLVEWRRSPPSWTSTARSPPLSG